MAAIAIDSTMVVGDCESEVEFDSFYERYRCRKLSESFRRRVHSLRDWGSEYLHPWLLMVLLAGAETIHYMLVGIEMLPFIIVGITAMVTFSSLTLTPYVLLIAILNASNDEDFEEGLHRAGVFGICVVVLLFPLGLLSWCVFPKVTGLLLHKADEIFPALGFIIYFALIELLSVFAGLAAAVMMSGFLCVGLGIPLSFFMLWVLLSYIPWYVLLPLTGFLFIFLKALLGQIWSSCSKSSRSTTSDHKDENADSKLQNPEDSKPQESEASELRPEV